jgi:hypothetical protein
VRERAGVSFFLPFFILSFLVCLLSLSLSLSLVFANSHLAFKKKLHIKIYNNSHNILQKETSRIFSDSNETVVGSPSYQ